MNTHPVNAAVTKRALPLLHAINDGRMPVFTESCLVGMTVPPAAVRQAVEGNERSRAADQERDRDGPLVAVYNTHAGA